MSLGLVLLFLHITTMIAAVVVSYGPALLFTVAERSRNVPALRALAVPTPIGPAIPILYVVGGLFGLATAINFGYNLLAPWLVIAYALWTVAMFTGVAIHRPYFVRANATLQAAQGNAITPEIAVLLADPRERAADVVDYIVIVLILFDMVVKPFS